MDGCRRHRGTTNPLEASISYDPLQTFDGPNIQTLTCVVVEDDLTMRQLVTNYLEENGIRAISASRRDEVPGILARHKPDLVVLDLCLGQQDGLDLLREIRAESDLPVIIATGYRRDEIDRVIGLELGADDYLTKPFGFGRASRPHQGSSQTARCGISFCATRCREGALAFWPVAD